jgi:hypothetical protein
MSSIFAFLTQRRSFLIGLLGVPAAAAATHAAPSKESHDKPLYEKPFAAFQNKTLEQKVQEIADREEIRELIARYAQGVAHGISVAPLFTDDGSFIMGMPGSPDQQVKGRKEIDKFYGTLVGTEGKTLPMIHNYLIEITGNEATGLCSIEVRTSNDAKSMIGSGYYADKYRKENGRWKFVLRDARMYHWVPLQEGWAKTTKAG